MIIRTYFPHNWQLGRNVRRYNWTIKNHISEHKITNMSPRCVILDDHSTWCKVGQRIGQSYDGKLGYILMVMTREEEVRTDLLNIVSQINWDSIDLDILETFTQNYSRSTE